MIEPNTDLLASCSSSPQSDSRTCAAAPADDPRPHGCAESREKAELVQLIRRVERDDPAAQSELVRRYTRRVAGFVRSIIRQPEAVDDVTQMIFIKMFRRLARLRDPAVFESWLFTLARNTSLDFIRRRKCRPETVTLDDEINRIADPSNASATTEILAALDRALARLTPVDRALVTQFVAGESYGDIAAHAGLSLATVKVRLHRVRPFLRTWVGEMTDTRTHGGKGWRCVSGGRTSTPWPTPSTRVPESLAA
jgi:RNA polymerase sigma-70 factor, ECF subfamily